MDFINDLKDYQKSLIKELLDKFIKINEFEIKDLFVQETMTCRKCNGSWFVKNGKYKHKQRYKCKSCGSTQFIDANTSMYNLKLKSKWIDFVVLMLEAEKTPTCANISKELQIDVKTAHSWRHKLMASLMEVESLQIKNEVEMDEIYLPFRVKGRIGKEKYEKYICENNSENKKSELREKEIVMEQEKYQSIYLCSHNRNNDFDFKPIKVQKKGIVSEKDLKRVIPTDNLDSKTVITDSEPSMKAFFKNLKQTNHLTFKSSYIKQGVIKENIHNNNINNVVKRMKEWLGLFHGVSTKYEINYLKWFRFKQIFNLDEFKQMIKKTVKDKQAYLRNKNTFIFYKDFIYI